MPGGFVFVYAPRDEAEEETVRAILRASIAFATSDEHGAGSGETFVGAGKESMEKSNV